ncbi:hypothetical protein Huta_0518 [Halorhabdus utahensis DSM 12940]|uniref:Uncharacterized protein n=2 Tax=Halorhabdus utahensis TaxID=146826 RepID=C7NS98_HALUD|nr:hypothetical protein Huta_0518 [Halorhabdus utahensis DSM 12940]
MYHMITRRQVLAAVGVSSTLAGCPAVFRGEHVVTLSDETTIEIPASPEDVPVSNGDRSLPSDIGENIHTEVTLGDRVTGDSPHDVRILNPLGVPEIYVGIVDLAADSVVYDERHPIPEDKKLQITLLEHSDYLVAVSVPEIERQHTVRVPCDYFDCNDSTTYIGIDEDGQISSSIFREAVACPSPC